MDNFQIELAHFLRKIFTDRVDDNSYWKKVIEGIELLLKYRNSYTDKQLFINKYVEVRNGVVEEKKDRLTEEISDELWAILINAYPMPDFWICTLDDFKSHPSFR